MNSNRLHNGFKTLWFYWLGVNVFWFFSKYRHVGCFCRRSIYWLKIGFVRSVLKLKDVYIQSDQWASWPLTSELTVEFSHRSCWRCVHWCSVNVMFVWRSAETWADVSMQVCKVNSVMWPRQTSVWLEWKSFIIKINFDMTEVNTFDGFQYVRFCIISFVMSYWFDYILFFLCDFSFNLNGFFLMFFNVCNLVNL